LQIAHLVPLKTVGMTEVTTDTTDRNDWPIAVSGIGNGAGQG